jgi:hypothetical protein
MSQGCRGYFPERGGRHPSFSRPVFKGKDLISFPRAVVAVIFSLMLLEENLSAMFTTCPFSPRAEVGKLHFLTLLSMVSVT